MNSFWKKQFFGDEPEPLMIDDKLRRFRCDTGIHLNFPENSKMKLPALSSMFSCYEMPVDVYGMPANKTWSCPKVFNLH